MMRWQHWLLLGCLMLGLPALMVHLLPRHRAGLMLLGATALLTVGSVAFVGKEPRYLAAGAIPCLLAASLFLVPVGRSRA